MELNHSPVLETGSGAGLTGVLNIHLRKVIAFGGRERAGTGHSILQKIYQ